MIIVAEKINASFPAVKAVIEKRDEAKLIELAKLQAAAGASYIDVNVGTGMGSRNDEVSAMRWAVATIQNEIETPLCIDSADPAVLEAGLEARGGKPSLINSVKADGENLDRTLNLIKEHDETPIVALAMDESGIPPSKEKRLNALEKIALACEKYGVSLGRVYFDPLVIPVSTDSNQGQITLDTLLSIKEEFPSAKSIIGLANVSYGLPGRGKLNTAFLQMAIFAGLDAAILDPLETELMDGIKAAEALMGRDRHFRRYTRAFRKKK